jgi:transposase-like protein
VPTGPVPVTNALRRLSEAMPKGMFVGALEASLAEPIEVEVAALCNTASGERTDERAVGRNGCCDRDLESRVGTIQLALPRVCQETYLPGSLKPRHRGVTAPEARYPAAAHCARRRRRCPGLHDLPGGVLA